MNVSLISSRTLYFHGKYVEGNNNIYLEEFGLLLKNSRR